jgi:hypothetical protein
VLRRWLFAAAGLVLACAVHYGAFAFCGLLASRNILFKIRSDDDIGRYVMGFLVAWPVVAALGAWIGWRLGRPRPRA